MQRKSFIALGCLAALATLGTPGPVRAQGRINTDVDLGFRVIGPARPQPSFRPPINENPFNFGRDVMPWIDLGVGIANAVTPQRPPNMNSGGFQQPMYYPNPNMGYQPQYVPQHVPQYTPSVPSNTLPPRTSPPVPVNTLARRQAAPKNDVDFSLVGRRASAETDARQQVEVERSEAQLDMWVSQMVTASLMSAQQSGNPAQNAAWQKINQEWNDVMRAGSKTEDVQRFIDTYGPNGSGMLTPDMLDALTLRQDFAAYGTALANGTLTDAGRELVLARLHQQVADEAARPGRNQAFFATLAGNVTTMQNFNTLGQLADAAQQNSNPFPVLIQGADQIGMPVMFVSDMTGFPVMPIDPIGGAVPVGAAPATVQLVNPVSTGQTVTYLLDGHRFTMEAGHQQRLNEGSSLTFDPGAGGQSKTYQLSAGVYQWRVDDSRGWDLEKVKAAVVIDNTRYNADFHYLLNKEAKTVARGQTAEHNSDLPLEIAFDPGNGGAEVRKLLKPGRYAVGLDPDQGRLDLFDAQKVEQTMAQQPPYVSSTQTAGANATRSERVEALFSQLKPPVKKRHPLDDAGPIDPAPKLSREMPRAERHPLDDAPPIGPLK